MQSTPADEPTPKELKEALRVQFQQRRAALSADAYARKSAAIIERLQALPEIQAAETVHCYWPRTERREVDTRPLIDWLHERGRTVVLPVVTAFEGAPEMEHRRYEGPESLRTNRWGLKEPEGTETVSPAALDLIVVPAFGAGRNGHRIGHGFGYYDAFLNDLDAVTVCPVYHACLVDTVPAEAHDVPLSVILTEEKVIRPQL